MKDHFICPHCGTKLTCYESFEEYRDEEMLIMTEHYECQECHKEIEKGERVVTYKVEREKWH